MHPDPVKDALINEGKTECTYEVRITSLSGSFLDHFNVHGSEPDIDVAGLQQGMYFISLPDPEKIEVRVGRMLKPDL